MIFFIYPVFINCKTILIINQFPLKQKIWGEIRENKKKLEILPADFLGMSDFIYLL